MGVLVEMRHRRQPLSKTYRDGDGAQWLLVCAASDEGLSFVAFGPHVPDGIGDPPPSVWPDGDLDLGDARGWSGAEAALARVVAMRAEWSAEVDDALAPCM